MAVCTSILKDNYKTLIALPDEEKSNEARLETEKLLHQGSCMGLCTYEKDNMIKFINGSSIEFVVPEKASDTIRGRRSKLPMLLYDYEYCNQEEIDKVLEPFMRKE
jgi:hypothetical protein